MLSLCVTLMVLRLCAWKWSEESPVTISKVRPCVSAECILLDRLLEKQLRLWLLSRPLKGRIVMSPLPLLCLLLVICCYVH